MDSSVDRALILASRKHNWSGEFAEGIREDYMAFLGRASSGGSETPSPAVDQLWHQHILFTREYGRFCETEFGCMIHHEPYLDAVEGLQPCGSIASASHAPCGSAASARREPCGSSV